MRPTAEERQWAQYFANFPIDGTNKLAMYMNDLWNNDKAKYREALRQLISSKHLPSSVTRMNMMGKKYQIIYADPPWKFGNRMYSSNRLDHHRKITRAYPVLKTSDICKLPIRDITDDNCVCFMWVADAFIPDAIQIIEAWGFKYKTVAFIWQKREKSGKQTCYMGQWTMKNCELVLLGTKGKMAQYLKSRKVRQLQEAIRERTIHSRKPTIIRDKIVEMFGDLPRIELFARQKVEGWDCWGNEVESDIDLSLLKGDGE